MAELPNTIIDVKNMDVFINLVGVLDKIEAYANEEVTSYKDKTNILRILEEYEESL